MCDLNLWIGVNARVVVARFARRHLWGICAAVNVGSQCVVARFARRHLYGYWVRGCMPFFMFGNALAVWCVVL